MKMSDPFIFTYVTGRQIMAIQLYNRSFDKQTVKDHLNTKLVCYSDSHFNFILAGLVLYLTWHRTPSQMAEQAKIYTASWIGGH